MIQDSQGPGRLSRALAQLKAGDIDRRQFIARAAGLGLGTTAITTILQAPAIAREASLTPATVRPDVGTEGQVRGEGGDVRILIPQAASMLSIHAAPATKDVAAASIISEPLLAYAPDTSLVPTLVSQVPTRSNGLLADDLSSVTFNLLPDVLWSDGAPFTAADVVFTWEWNVNPVNRSIHSASWELLSDVRAVDDLTVKATLARPNLGWFLPFTSNVGAIYPRHFWEGKDLESANQEFALGPVGTGAFVLKELSPNDQVVYVANDNYREPGKPYFGRVILKGGDDAASLVRAVTVTGDWDLAFRIQIDPTALKGILGDQGAVIYGPPGTGVEKIQFNFSDPNTEVDGQRSQKDTPHPFLTDLSVRQAICYAIDRATLS